MDFKHFSHPHPLTHHQIPPPNETLICSGCNLPLHRHVTATTTSPAVYMCCQCQFFLHHQCFNAARSLHHPSHSSHPLSLIPYPTYPSGSFICNTCEQQGTGFSYSCSNCDFDVHIHCAHNDINNYVPSQHFGDISAPSQNHYSHSPNHFLNIQHALMPENIISRPEITNSTNSLNYETPISYPNVSYPNQVSFPSQTQDHFPTHAQYSDHQSHFRHEHVKHQIVTNNIPNLAYPTTQYPFMPDNPTYYPITNNAPSLVNGKPNENILNHGTTNTISLPQPKGVKHFSHQHPLDLHEVKGKNIVCFGCEKEISGLAYECIEASCKSALHQQCFGLPRELKHKSHEKHPLTLLTSPPYKEGFTCNACLTSGNAFTYHCSTCKFDLHVTCAFLPETVRRNDHAHILSLVHSLPDYTQEEEHDPACDVCQGVVDIKKTWFYFCQDCDFGTHLDCVNAKAMVQQQETKAKEDLLAAALVELQVLELKQRLSRLNADFSTK